MELRKQLFAMPRYSVDFSDSIARLQLNVWMSSVPPLHWAWMHPLHLHRAICCHVKSQLLCIYSRNGKLQRCLRHCSTQAQSEMTRMRHVLCQTHGVFAINSDKFVTQLDSCLRMFCIPLLYNPGIYAFNQSASMLSRTQLQAHLASTRACKFKLILIALVLYTRLGLLLPLHCQCQGSACAHLCKHQMCMPTYLIHLDDSICRLYFCIGVLIIPVCNPTTSVTRAHLQESGIATVQLNAQCLACLLSINLHNEAIIIVPAFGTLPQCYFQLLTVVELCGQLLWAATDTIHLKEPIPSFHLSVSMQSVPSIDQAFKLY
mmetsp:Transcript_44059/g.101681  ORF Transcript_44059/g.101681 Transcript_44059/m.101681 type:complete len:318 (+) Transcript_44059:1203-2156(+)